MARLSYAHIYLSPHMDDVVLSCGGTIYSRTRGGDHVLVVSFFAGSPADDSITDFARELKERWGGEDDPVAVRRAEDVRALRILGADSLHLEYLDCVYRLGDTGEPRYPTEGDIFGRVHPAEANLHYQLLSAFVGGVGDLTGATVCSPLAVGHHVDHVLVRRMAMLLAQCGQRVLFYEDYPYSEDPSAVREALAAWPDHCWSRELVRFNEGALRAKADAAVCYASQISTFWSRPDEMRQALRAQALAVGGDGYAEGYWSLSPECLSEDEFGRM